MIVAADLHLREETESVVLDEVLPELFHASLQDPDRAIALLGDFWHVRYRIPVRLLNRVSTFLESLNNANIRLVLLPGNHDQINVQGENALEILGSHKGVYVYTEPTIDGFGLWVPYRKKIEEVEKIVEGYNNFAIPKVLWMHHGFRGALMNNGMVNKKDGSSGEVFSTWDYVFSGHYHRRQKVGKVYYIGSPYQIRADEAGQDKGYAIWNRTTKQMRWVNEVWGKRYHQIRTDGSPMNLSGVSPRDELRVLTDPGVDSELVGKQLEAQGFRNVVVNPVVQMEQARLSVASSASISDYARAYVEEKSGDLNSDFLMQLFDQFSGRV